MIENKSSIPQAKASKYKKRSAISEKNLKSESIDAQNECTANLLRKNSTSKSYLEAAQNSPKKTRYINN